MFTVCVLVAVFLCLYPIWVYLFSASKLESDLELLHSQADQELDDIECLRSNIIATVRTINADYRACLERAVFHLFIATATLGLMIAPAMAHFIPLFIIFALAGLLNLANAILLCLMVHSDQKKTEDIKSQLALAQSP